MIWGPETRDPGTQGRRSARVQLAPASLRRAPTHKEDHGEEKRRGHEDRKEEEPCCGAAAVRVRMRQGRGQP